MKVIDLLNKIANGEQPQHIRVYNRDWYWNNYDGYVTKESLKTTPDAQIYLFSSYRLDFALDKEVEIIEENNKIEKISVKTNNYNVRKVANKLNELIDEVNKLKEDK